LASYTLAFSLQPRKKHGKPSVRVKLKDIAPIIGTNGEEEYNILKFSAYYETAKFTKDPSD
jgi:hypothetical protein